ncbi:CLUMA_CG017917, isoform A [Clunio marinus]|uniref:CLUMA_CG017917, isoform A n=1 Tax=Clunio marinus TaxID=568069 RepID=A0A1J1IXQ8_9DIPT|nr:CLUMA_CG017917, isoform A [Clunio marinus]
MASLIRAVSWPLISTSPLETEKDCAGNTLMNGKNGSKHKHALTFQQLIAARRLICRRYYPEGSWGWVIVFVGVVVNILTHGLQLSAFTFLIPAGHRFKVNEVEVDCLGELKS